MFEVPGNKESPRKAIVAGIVIVSRDDSFVGGATTPLHPLEMPSVDPLILDVETVV
jgi:hypothetical protein